MREVIRISIDDNVAFQLLNRISWVKFVLSAQISENSHTLSELLSAWKLKNWNLGSRHGCLKCWPILECDSMICEFNTSESQDLSCGFTSSVKSEIM